MKSEDLREGSGSWPRDAVSIEVDVGEGVERVGVEEGGRRRVEE